MPDRWILHQVGVEVAFCGDPGQIPEKREIKVSSHEDKFVNLKFQLFSRKVPSGRLNH